MDTSRHAAPNACTPGGDASRAAHAADGLAFLARFAANEAATLTELEDLVLMQRQIAAPARGAARRTRRSRASDANTHANQAIHADEAARRRLARELHDSVGAELAATRFALANVHTWLPASAPPQCAEALALVARSLDAATGAMRHVLDGLHAPQLDAGLAPALAAWMRGFAARSGLAAQFASASDDARLARLPANAALAVFRVAQEALVNVARHAQATRAEVRLESTARHLTLTVADDGIGLARRGPAHRRGGAGHYGLAGMRERCAAFGGSLRAASGGIAHAHDDATQRGTTVRARFAWDALLAASAHPASPVILPEGARS
ncbi:sensor histidine kinase [Paraburkholderia lycopersici]|uniref:histidine kinase n=1 Tax=Paraburkholderia lycopersici TaxID=416944 RepID=A0A1G6GZD5_9BURK|nr:ATP-binding protein [Paraburkholderia lycopersici]SDB87321.1 Signal transduction histidine kinase [Paraburkholderia lycopersici]